MIYISEKDAVKAGFDLLNDSYGPEWVERVDWSMLKMHDTVKCVLGQLSPPLDTDEDMPWAGYGRGLEALAEYSKVERGEESGDYISFAAKHGFDTCGTNMAYHALEREWRLITNRPEKSDNA